MSPSRSAYLFKVSSYCPYALYVICTRCSVLWSLADKPVYTVYLHGAVFRSGTYPQLRYSIPVNTRAYNLPAVFFETYTYTIRNEVQSVLVQYCTSILILYIPYRYIVYCTSTGRVQSRVIYLVCTISGAAMEVQWYRYSTGSLQSICTT